VVQNHSLHRPKNTLKNGLFGIFYFIYTFSLLLIKELILMNCSFVSWIEKNCSSQGKRQLVELYFKETQPSIKKATLPALTDLFVYYSTDDEFITSIEEVGRIIGYQKTQTGEILRELENLNFIVKKRRLVYEIYLDGIFVAKDSLNNGNITSSNSPNPLLIGAVYDSPGQNLTSKFSGILDDIAIWNRALSQSEITQLYNQGICQTSITVTDTLLIHTGITSYNPVAYGNTLKVWPNPGNTAITLDAGNLSSMQGWKYKVANTLGQTVVNETAINQQQTNISLSTWGGNGIYYLHLINPQGHAIEIKKIVLAP
jgi:hypothetical protein